MQYIGSEYAPFLSSHTSAFNTSSSSGYLQSCRDIVTHARRIANTITTSIPELYVLGSPPASVVAFGARDASVNVYEVGDRMSKKGLHLNALSGPAAVHIACTRLTLQVVETFISDLKASVAEAKDAPEGKGTMVASYGGFLSRRSRVYSWIRCTRREGRVSRLDLLDGIFLS